MRDCAKCALFGGDSMFNNKVTFLNEEILFSKISNKSSPNIVGFKSSRNYDNISVVFYKENSNLDKIEKSLDK